MKVFTNKKYNELLYKLQEKELNKIFRALQYLHERDNSDSTGVVRERKSELLDIAYKHMYSNPVEDVRYRYFKLK
jgi:hypothetical protein